MKNKQETQEEREIREECEAGIRMYNAFKDGPQSLRWDGSVYMSDGMVIHPNGEITEET